MISRRLLTATFSPTVTLTDYDTFFLQYRCLMTILSFVVLYGREVMIVMGTQELLTTAEAAEILRMRPESVSRKVQRGEIPGVKIGKRWLIRKETLDAMLQPSEPQGE
jgi:excisionase family DNA binding protein